MDVSVIEAAKAALRKHGTKAAAARALGVPVSTFKDRLNGSGSGGISPKGRKHISLQKGLQHALIGSDFHYWPGPPSTGHRAFVHFAKTLQPELIVANGDVLDFAGISRHPPLGWENEPTVREELDVSKERLGEIEEASPDSARYWPVGNHDERFEMRLAMVAPEFKEVHGIHLKDHFPNWKPCYSLFINGDVVVKHRFKGGIHAAHNNAVGSGMTIICGHLHSGKVIPYTDYRGTRYGVDTGCIADPYAPCFQGYLEDNPRNWRSSFCILTFRDGYLLQPELVMVVDDGLVQFRGELIEV